MKHLLLLLAVGVLDCLHGCATVARIEPGTGPRFTVQDRTYQEVWDTSLKVVSRHLTIVEKNKDYGVIKAHQPPGMQTWGELLGLFIVPSDPTATTFTIEVTGKKRSAAEEPAGYHRRATIIEELRAEFGL